MSATRFRGPHPTVRECLDKHVDQRAKVCDLVALPKVNNALRLEFALRHRGDVADAVNGVDGPRCSRRGGVRQPILAG